MCKKGQQDINLNQYIVYFQENKKDSPYALALANRSAVQMRFGETGIKRALADVERALNAGHPAPIKLLERKIDCLLKLGLFSKVCNRLTYNLM